MSTRNPMGVKSKKWNGAIPSFASCVLTARFGGTDQSQHAADERGESHGIISREGLIPAFAARLSATGIRIATAP
jgi:hypothetical protein